MRNGNFVASGVRRVKMEYNIALPVISLPLFVEEYLLVLGFVMFMVVLLVEWPLLGGFEL